MTGEATGFEQRASTETGETGKDPTKLGIKRNGAQTQKNTLLRDKFPKIGNADEDQDKVSRHFAQPPLLRLAKKRQDNYRANVLQKH